MLSARHETPVAFSSTGRGMPQRQDTMGALIIAGVIEITQGNKGEYRVENALLETIVARPQGP